jgi:hypothetical protein
LDLNHPPTAVGGISANFKTLSQILCRVMIARLGAPIKRNRRLRGKGSGLGNDEFFRLPFWKNAARAL